MKTVEIKLCGIGRVFWVESIIDRDKIDRTKMMFDIEEDGGTNPDSLQEITILLIDVEVSVEGNSIIKQKGKYLNTKDYYSKTISNPSYVILVKDGKWLEQTFTITLKDDEVFDPKKVQLVKTDYELDFIPYGILTDYIMYDGKKIEGDGCPTDCMWFSNYDNYIVDYDLPYV